MLTRKVLQTVQASSKVAVEKEKVTMSEADTTSKAKKVKAAPAKSSKRKKVDAENNPPKTTSKEVTKKGGASKKAAAKAKTKKGGVDLQKTVIINQSRLENFLSPLASSSSSIASSICDDSSVPILGATILNKSVSEDKALITSETKSEAYWQELAEQRNIAIVEANSENEGLRDELTVLETENMLLKNALNAAEKLLQTAGLLESKL